MHQELGLDFDAKESLLASKADVAGLMRSKQDSDAKIANRIAHHEQLRLQEARLKMTQVAMQKADENDSEESSIDTEKEKTFTTNGIDVVLTQKVFTGITADTSSDEENIPPSLAAVYKPIDGDITDARMNPFITKAQTGSTPSDLSASNSESVVPKTSDRPYNPEADPWKFDLNYSPNRAISAAETSKLSEDAPKMEKKIRLSIATHCCQKYTRCQARPCAKLIDHDPLMNCSCKLALVSQCGMPPPTSLSAA